MLVAHRKIARALGVAVGGFCLVVASRAVALSGAPGVPNLRQPPLYVIEGYLDSAPEGAEIRDRVDISARGRRHTLLVTRYGTPGETGLDRYLSRVMQQPFAIEGMPEEVERLGGAPRGAKIVGTFTLYIQGPPRLRIADLTEPAPES